MLSTAFRKRGWTVVQAYDAMQSVMFAMQAPSPDVILLDLGMPGGTGITALTRLKASANTAAIPVIVISGADDAATIAEVEALGAVRFLAKPVAAGDVVTAVEEVTGAGAGDEGST